MHTSPSSITDGYVLLVDDEPHVTHIMARRLRTEGIEVEVARDGIEALEVISSERPVCIVTDLQMPRMNGIELARTLESSPDNASIPMILLTARDFLVDGAGDVPSTIRKRVSKPFSAETLLEAIRTILAGDAPAQRQDAA